MGGIMWVGIFESNRDIPVCPYFPRVGLCRDRLCGNIQLFLNGYMQPKAPLTEY